MKRHLKNLNLPFKLVITVLILGALIVRMDADIVADFGKHFRASAWGYAMLFMLLQLCLLSLRWKDLLNIGRLNIGFADTMRINLASQLANLIFITSVGGALARIALSIQHGTSLFKSLIATLLDRILTLSALLFLSVLFIPGLADHADSHLFKAFSTYISVLAVVMFVFTPLFFNKVVLRMPQIAKLKGWARYALRYLKIVLNNPFLCGKLLVTSVAAQTSFFVAVFFLARSTGVSLGFFELMTVLPMISLISSLPIGIGGWGVREGAFVYGLGLLGVPMETAFLISIQVGIVGMITIIAGGFPALITSDFKLDRLSMIKERLAGLKR